MKQPSKRVVKAFLILKPKGRVHVGLLYEALHVYLSGFQAKACCPANRTVVPCEITYEVPDGE